MTFRVHALYVAGVIPVLQTVARRLRGSGPCESANQESRARAHRCTLMSVDCGTGRSAKNGANDGAGNPAPGCRLAGGHTADAF